MEAFFERTHLKVAVNDAVFKCIILEFICKQKLCGQIWATLPLLVVLFAITLSFVVCKHRQFADPAVPGVCAVQTLMSRTPRRLSKD